MWNEINLAFDCLPFAALIDGKIFCTHGGISANLTDLDQLRYLKRPKEIPRLFSDNATNPNPNP